VGAADCATYATALHTCDTTADHYVVVRKSARNLAFCNNGALIANYHAALGSAPLDDKAREGDGRTPQGTYYVAAKLDPSQFHKALLLSYPSTADADQGLVDDIIDQSTRDSIAAANTSCGVPDQNTGMGGEIEIHGNNNSTLGDWTVGCVAVTDAEIDAIFLDMEVGDTIVVIP
jgi:murein L,D-transpeptidase YafK